MLLRGKRAKVRSHMTPLREKAREGEESHDTPAPKSARRRGVTWCPEGRILSASQISPDYYASCLRPFTWCSTRSYSSQPVVITAAILWKTARRRGVTWCPEGRILSASQISPDYYASCLRPFTWCSTRSYSSQPVVITAAILWKTARRRGVTWCLERAHPISLPDFAGLLRQLFTPLHVVFN